MGPDSLRCYLDVNDSMSDGDGNGVPTANQLGQRWSTIADDLAHDWPQVAKVVHNRI